MSASEKGGQQTLPKEAGQKVPPLFALYAGSSLVRDLIWATARASIASVLIFVPDILRRLGRALGLRFLLGDASAEPGCTFYEGRVVHVRTWPTEHRFRYAVRYALVDLDNPPSWFTRLQPDCLTAQEARAIAGTAGPVRWLSFPRSMGYEQNPISVYYCYGAGTDVSQPGAQPEMCVAAVTNTPWGERVHFAFKPGKDHVPKPLHVSPFMRMNTYWKIYGSAPGESLSLTITAEDKEHGAPSRVPGVLGRLFVGLKACTHHATLLHPGTFFTAMLRADAAKKSISRSPDAWFWMMPHLVAIWIYWEAVLLLSKGVSFVSHPKYGSGERYRREAGEREGQLPRTCRGAASEAKNGSGGGSCPVFNYRDASSWPWTY